MSVRYKLRWRFDYSDGKRSRWGMWDSSGPKEDVATKAAYQPRENMSFASVEGKNVETGEIVTLLQVPGQDFMVFQWDAAAFINPFGVGRPVTPPTRLTGLRLVSRNAEYVVRSTGVTETYPLSEAAKTINFATYGR